VSRRARALLPVLLLLLPPCLLLWPVVGRGEAFLPADLLRDVAPWRTSDPHSLVPWNPLMWDGIAEFYPWRLFAAETLRSGFLPLWNPHQFCGTPFVANSQSAVFYPLNLLFCLSPVKSAFGASVLLHLWLTGCFAYLYLRSPALKLGRPASLLGAVGWQLCHWQVAWLALPTFLCVSAWLPLALWLADRAASRPTPARAVPLGLCLGVLLLAGHLQIALYCLGLIFAYALLRVAPLFRMQWPALPACAGLTLALAFGLAAPQLLPAVELARVSHRAGGAATGAAYAGYVRLAVPPANLVTLFAPGFFGSPTRGTFWGEPLNGGPGAYMEDAAYGGVLTLLLALLGVAATWKARRETRFFALAALAALLLALGSPLNALLFFGIPGFAQTGSPGRVLVLWSFCLPVLAAIGTQALLETGAARAGGRALAAFVLLLLLTGGYTAWWVNTHYPVGALANNLAGESDTWRVPLGLLPAAGAALWLRQRGSLTAGGLGTALAALVAADLLAAGAGFNRTTAPGNVYPATALTDFLRQHRSEGRIMPLNRRWSLTDRPPPAILPPNVATVYGLDDTQGYDSLLTGQYFAFAGALDGGSPAPPENGNMVFTYGAGSREAREAAARWIVTLEPLSGQQPVWSGGGAFVYEDEKAADRIQMRGGKSEGYGPAYFLPGWGPNQVRVLMNDGFAAPQSLVVADQWYPGWRAYFHGEEVQMTQGPDVFRTLTLSARQQHFSALNNPLEMRYEPEAFRVGLYALCVAMGAAAAVTAAASHGKLGRRRHGL